MVVEEAFPCKSLEGSATDGMNVEIDPVSELAVADKITSKNMRIVGWYHSHPLFQPDPSVRDIQTQSNYQALFRDPVSQCEPFIGAIAGMLRYIKEPNHPRHFLCHDRQ